MARQAPIQKEDARRRAIVRKNDGGPDSQSVLTFSKTLGCCCTVVVRSAAAFTGSPARAGLRSGTAFRAATARNVIACGRTDTRGETHDVTNGPVTTSFYRTHLADLHQRLLDHVVVQSYLTGTGLRYDGARLAAADRFELPFGEISTLEFAHLFSVFDGSRVHQQAEKRPSHDDAPPGLYFTVINNRLIQNQHKNRAGLVTEEIGTTDLFIDALHIDHFFLNERNTPPHLGAFAFALSAITAHLLGLAHVTLVAAGGRGFNPRHIGYRVWPKLGFDADLLPGEVDAAPQCSGCRTVQDVLAADPAWWEQNGSQRRMTFDLAAQSRSWRKLIPYVLSKASVEDPHA